MAAVVEGGKLTGVQDRKVGIADYASLSIFIHVYHSSHTKPQYLYVIPCGAARYLAMVLMILQF